MALLLSAGCAPDGSTGGDDDGGDQPCRPETDQAFCGRLRARCDSVSSFDNCGASRTVMCGSCSAPESCGGGGQPNVCGVNRCTACTSPPPAACVNTGRARFEVERPASPGRCSDPATGECSYSATVERCAEDCRGATCVETPCTLTGFECTTRGTGCKLATPTQLRCLHVSDDPAMEGVSCGDTRIPEAPDNRRCASKLRCVWPSYVSGATCAYLCRTSADCQGVGLRRRHVCVTDPSAAFGFCD